MDVVWFFTNSIRSLGRHFIHSHQSSLSRESMLLRQMVTSHRCRALSSVSDLLTQPPMLDVGLNTLQLSYSSWKQNEKNGKHEIDSKEAEKICCRFHCAIVKASDIRDSLSPFLTTHSHQLIANFIAFFLSCIIIDDTRWFSNICMRWKLEWKPKMWIFATRWACEFFHLSNWLSSCESCDESCETPEDEEQLDALLTHSML